MKSNRNSSTQQQNPQTTIVESNIVVNKEGGIKMNKVLLWFDSHSISQFIIVYYFSFPFFQEFQ